jgi:hypothetical protein
MQGVILGVPVVSSCEPSELMFTITELEYRRSAERLHIKRCRDGKTQAFVWRMCLLSKWILIGKILLPAALGVCVCVCVCVCVSLNVCVCVSQCVCVCTQPAISTTASLISKDPSLERELMGSACLSEPS